jgi:valyl-tRNA synthetase
MICSHLLGRDGPPFSTVYLHPMVRDARGQKMSKSVGNVIDPLHVLDGVSHETMREALVSSQLAPTELKKALKGLERDFPSGIQPSGADALRLGLLEGLQQGVSLNLDPRRLKAARHLGNKLWNATRFTVARMPDVLPSPLRVIEQGGALEAWLLSRTAVCVAHTEHALENYSLSVALAGLRRFVWEDICGVGIEWVKATGAYVASETVICNCCSLDLVCGCSDARDRDGPACAVGVALEAACRLFHPFMPFLTETLWQHLPPTEGGPKHEVCS